MLIEKEEAEATEEKFTYDVKMNKESFREK